MRPDRAGCDNIDSFRQADIGRNRVGKKHRSRKSDIALGTIQCAHKFSKGIPRELNRLAKLALEYAWLREMPYVEETALETVVRDLSRHQQLCPA